MKHRNRVLAFLMTLVMIISQFAGNAITVHAEPGTVSNVKYLDDKGISKNCAEATVVTAGDTAWNDGWYAVTADTTCGGRITVTGTVHLILCDKATLTATKGVTVNEGNSLYIYAQSTGTDAGELRVTGPETYTAGIGGGVGEAGGAVTINGGSVTVTGGDSGAGIGGGVEGSGGVITINRGEVTVTGGGGFSGGYGGAGIGGGDSGAGGTITINGGEVTATGGVRGAGIGGGSCGEGGNITIKGGQVTATGGDYGAGIGGGDSSAGIGGGDSRAGGTITINGGQVTATGGVCGAGIGGGVSRPGGEITINGGEVTATGGDYGAGIGGGEQGAGGSITMNGGNVSATGGNNGAGIGGGKDGAGGEITINGGSVTATGGQNGAGIGGGNNGEGGTITITDGTVSATGGEYGAGIGGGLTKGGGTIVIDGGTVSSNGGDNGAGIGGGDGADSGTITINDGTVSSNGGDRAAGIGGGYNGAGGTITINCGNVTANGGSNGAGIGGGGYGAGGTIAISGGEITATGGNGGAGIGGGYEGAGGEISIDDGEITATGGYNGAGIGGGWKGDGITINVAGGAVTATGGTHGAGIGGGNAKDSGTVTIAGGTVNAYGGAEGAGVGGGRSGAGKNITINDGSVTAIGGSKGAGIGGGLNEEGRNITINGGLVTAVGGEYGAGIGGGQRGVGSDITVDSGIKKITAAKGEGAKCIGNGANMASNSIIVFRNGETIAEDAAKEALFYDHEGEDTRIIRSKLVNHGISIAPVLQESVESDTVYAYEGETVTLTVNIENNISVDSDEANVLHGEAVIGSCTFTMPGENVTVKVIPEYNIPDDRTISCNKTLWDIALPEGFSFDDPDQVLDFGANRVKLVYTPEDTDNYATIKDLFISVTRKDHAWDEGKVTKVASCTEKGVKTYTCTICHETKTEEVEIVPHHLTATEAKAATCTEAGNIACWTCDVCGKHFSDAEGKTEITENSWIIPALGHKWGEWKVVKEATETEEGLEERVCENDPTHEETRPIPKKEKVEPVNPENPETPVNPETPDTPDQPAQPENPDTPDTPVQPETPKPDTQIPLTPSVNKSVKINDADVSVSINITYPKAVNWTGSKITQAQLAVLVQDGEIAKVKIEGLEKAIAALNKDADLSKLIKTSYVIGKKKKVGEKGSFYVKLSLNSKVCKKAKIKGKDKKALETLIKDINKEFKAHPYEFDIVPIDLNDADAIESVSIKAGFKNGELQLNDDGTIKKLKSLKIKVKIPGKKKAKTYSFSGKKITKSFTVKLTDPAAKKAEITALDGQNFKGNRSGVEIVK